MEYLQGGIKIDDGNLQPSEHEAEKASNSYLMSLVAAIAGLPIPIINLIATFIFYMGTRKSTYFVRWHSTQALLSQFSLLFINSFGFWWTVSIVFTEKQITNSYVAYIIVLFFFNVAEIVATIHSAVQTRKGQHVHWWIYGDLTNLICRR
jgi:uncharacterized Tic20 family protein